jgi:hypothetical protein
MHVRGTVPVLRAQRVDSCPQESDLGLQKLNLDDMRSTVS